MAFRRRRSFRSSGGSRFSRGARGWRSNRKWIGHGTILSPALVNVPGAPATLLEAQPQIVPLVNIPDYAPEEASLIDSDLRGQERTKVIRSIGHVSVYAMIVPANGDQVIGQLDVYGWFAKLNNDDFTDKQLLYATDTTAFDEWNMALEGSPPLWRMPVKKWFQHSAPASWLQTAGAIGLYHEGIQRSWDFQPRQAMQVPEIWALVLNVQATVLIPTPAPEAIQCVITTSGRTLIMD